MYPKASNQYLDNEVKDLEEEEEEELGEEVVETNGVRVIDKDNCDEEEDEEEEDSDDDEEDDEGNDDYDDDKKYNGEAEDVGVNRPRKKRKSRTLISNYEFAPRVRTPFAEKAEISQPSSNGQNSLGGWTEVETFALLDAWGERFLSLGKKSLRAEEWKEVSEKVSQVTSIERTDAQCRNRLDTLKKKYKKEKTRLMAGEMGSSKWVFYRKMDMLLCSPTQQQSGLSCGIDSGEYVFTNPNVYLNRANGLDEMRDSPGNSESRRGEKDDGSDGLPPKRKRKRKRGRKDEGSAVGLLADSIQKFGEVYEKVEINKRKQMVELENVRMDFYRQLETQRREILERAQAEIVKIRQGHDDENDLSAENHSG